MDNHKEKMFDLMETPAVIINMEIVKKNIFTMSEEVQKKGCALRPHIKTHKIPELAKLQLDSGACGITCAKLSEAAVMAEAGIRDIFIAYPIIGKEKVQKALELMYKTRLILSVDSLEGASMLSSVAVEKKKVFEVRMEIDTGLKRTGVAYEKAVEFAGELKKLPGLNLTGIYTFSGSLLDGKSTDRTDLAGVQEGNKLVEMAKRLREKGIPIADVSGGSTPTGKEVAGVEGVTEVRPGTYIFNDMMQVGYKTALIEECAATVLVTVVSTPSEELAVIDGGSKTFSADAPMQTFPLYLEGYGKVLGNEDLMFERMTEEHGMIRSKSGKTGLKVGQKLRIIPNHICTTINLHDFVFFMEAEGSVKKVQVAARGKLF